MVATISERVARYLERQGWLARDEQSDHLTLALDDEEGNTMQQLQGHSITYRIAMGPQAGRKVLTLQTIPAWGEDDYGNDQLGKIGGFSLHAGVAVNTRERKSWNVFTWAAPSVYFPPRTIRDEEADGREEPDQTAAKRKGMCCTLKGIKAQRLKRDFNRAAQVGPPRY